MNDLITAIIADLETNLPYLQQVKAVNSLLNPPSEKGFPCVGVKDGDITYDSHPIRRDRDVLNVEIGVYQDLIFDDSGASIIGSAPEQGARFKGVIEICQEVRARLNDNFFTAVFAGKIDWAHVDKVAASETLGDADQPLMQMKTMTVTYRRFS